MYDVVIAGGSISGLLCARQIASKGHSVLVIEEDHEIGTPEHCGGLISKTALEELSITPNIKTINHTIQESKVYSPSGKNFTIDASRQKVVEISRRELDKQVAKQAQRNGAEIQVGYSMQGATDDGISTNNGKIQCKIIVDARGITSIIQKDRTGMLTSAQYEVYADWIKKGTVEVILDSVKYPGFFAWVIPTDDGMGKVGVAGDKINAAKALEEFLASRKKSSIIRKIFAPIWVKGPIDNFVQNNTVIIGDAAGQAKPTTAGGIFSCGMGGILAGNAISEYLDTKDRNSLNEYQKQWQEKFGKEFERQLLARKVLAKMDNSAIERLFDSITPDITKAISENDDFDFHTRSILRLLGVKTSLKAAQVVLGSEIKKLFN